MKHRYPGIHSFTAEEQALFFGREREKKELFRLIVLNEVVILFGKSGTGKTSLLQAGVGPLLSERQLQPVKIRFNNTRQSIRRQIFEQLNERDFLPINTPDNLTLWEYCKQFEFAPGGERYAPVLLLDQFEELFTLYHNQPEAQQDFINQLTELLNYRVPNHLIEKAQNVANGKEREQLLSPPQVHIVISIRSDFLYLLDRLSSRIPSILRCRYELQALDEVNTRRAVTQPPGLTSPFASPMFIYSEVALQEMMDSFVSPDSNQITASSGSREVEPFQAQMLCRYIEQKIIAEKQPEGFVVTTDFYGGRTGIKNIRKQYYDSVISQFNASVRPKIEHLLGEFLISNDRRIIQERNYLMEKCTISEQDLALLCTERLLIEEPRGGSYYYEISHDTLVAPIMDSREERLAIEESEHLEKEKIEADLRAKEAEEQAIAEKLRAEEANKLRFEAEKQRNLAQENEFHARKNERQAQQRTRLAILLMAIALVLALFSIWSYKNIRDKNLTTFESFSNIGINLIYTLDHKDALDKFKIAAEIDIDKKTKIMKLKEPLCEILYFFSEANRRPELSISAARILLNLDPDDSIAPILKQCIQEQWKTREQFSLVYKKIPYFDKFQSRYYPTFVEVPLGKDSIFDMGSDTSEWGHRADEKLHKVKLNPYRIANTPTTFYQFALFCEATNKKIESRTPYWGRKGDNPMVNVNWYNAIEYSNWLNSINWKGSVYLIEKINNSDINNSCKDDLQKWKVVWNNTIGGIRLPTEAEWELAARGGEGGRRTLFSGSDTLAKVGWYWENSGDSSLSGIWDANLLFDNYCRTHATKLLQSNGIGLYDMSGNVFEWCWDWYSENYYTECSKNTITDDPKGAESSKEGRVVRGGSWWSEPSNCRVARRIGYYHPAYQNFKVGFRLVYTSK